MSLNIFEYVNNLAVEIHMERDTVFKQNDPSNGRMYFIAEGEISIQRDVDGEVHELAKLHAGSFFGEMAIINKSPRSATAMVTSKKAKLGYLDEEIFLKIGKLNPIFLYSLLKLVITRLKSVEDTIHGLLKNP